MLKENALEIAKPVRLAALQKNIVSMDVRGCRLINGVRDQAIIRKGMKVIKIGKLGVDTKCLLDSLEMLFRPSFGLLSN